MGRRFAFGALLAAGLAGGALAATEALPSKEQFKPVSRYDRLVESLSVRPFYETAEFARIAVEQMLLEHDEALLDLHDTTARDRKAARKRLTWGRATQQYLARLERMAGLMADGSASIEVVHTPAGEVNLFIEGQPVVVSSLNLARPGLLGEYIVDSFCFQFDCADIEADSPYAGQRYGEVDSWDNPLGGGWSFGDDLSSAYRTEDGLSFMFSDLSDRARKQRICAALVTELREIVSLLIRAEHAGYRIDWELLRLAPRLAGDGGPERLIFNRDGTFVRAPLPTLAAAADVLEISRSWIKARVAGQSYHQQFPRTDLFLGALLDR